MEPDLPQSCRQETKMDQNLAPTLHDRAYRRLKAALRTSVFPPGHKVTIRGCAEALGMSATPIRAAINRLVAEGALEMPSSRTVRVPIPTIARLAEITRLRLLTEPLAAAEATPLCGEDVIRKLERHQIEMAASAAGGDYKTYLALNEAFHFTLYEAAGMPVLCRLIETLWQQIGPYLYLLEPSMRGIEFHADALRAIRKGNPQATAEAIRADIQRAADHLARMLEKQTAAGNGKVDSHDGAATQPAPLVQRPKAVL
jgi:DNA-binding GntR family transcriptional regulator